MATSPLTPLAAAATGAALYGLADAAQVISLSTLDLSPAHQSALMLLDAGAMGLLGAAAGLVLLPVARLREPWPAFLWGLLVAVLAALGEWWFTTPPDFAAEAVYASIRGSAGLFVLIVGGLISIFAGLALFVPQPRQRIAVMMGVTFALAGRGLLARRDLLPLGDAPGPAPNVLLITLDTSRADHFGAYGDPLVQTPHFDALAAQGALVETASSQIPVTGPSHTTIHGGLPPWEHGALLNGVPVHPGVVLMAEYLRARGWRTGAFISAYVLEGQLGFNRGFEVYDDDFGWLQGWSGTMPGLTTAALTRRFFPTHVLERRGERTVEQALGWLEGHRSRPGTARPFFAWVHLFDPHGPYAPPQPWDTAYYHGDPRDPTHTSMAQVSGVADYLAPSLVGITDLSWVLAQYAGEISYTDAQLGRLLDWLDTTGLAENTLVVVVGDHGESLGEHEVWFNHGDDLFSAVTWVPMALRLPGKVPAGQTVKGAVELTDVAPTVYDLLGLEIPNTVSGRSLVDALDTGVFTGRPEARGLTFDRAANLAARAAGTITRPQYRMVSLRQPASYLYVLRDAPDKASRYYDLSVPGGEDGEGQPLPPGLSSLEATAQGVLESMSAEDLARSAAEKDAATQERLRALGYIE